MRHALAVAAALAALLAGGGARVKAQYCSPHDFVNRCGPEQYRRMLDLYGLPSIEAHRDAGDQVRRAFYVDGYDQDVVAISYVRSRGREPIVSVHLPRHGGSEAHEPLVASVPEDVWTQVVSRSRFFDRALEPARQADSDGVFVCLDPWVWTVEATDSFEPVVSERALRRRSDDSCSFGLAGQFAAELAEMTVPLFSYCRGLDLGHYRTEASLLADCFTLRGDRNTAAVVRNRVHDLARASFLSSPSAPEHFFAQDAEVHMAGGRLRGASPGRTWIDRIWGHMSNAARLSVDVVTAESSTRALVAGQLRRIWPRTSTAGDDDMRHEVADFEMIWAKQGGDFHLERVSVGEFEEESR